MRHIPRALEILREDGPVELVYRSNEYARQKIKNFAPFISDPAYMNKRVDNKRRWLFINDYLQEYDSVVDIGCAEGYFTVKSAREGLFSLGIENTTSRLSYAYDNWGFEPNLGFAQWDITPETIESIPAADVILFLTVYHHLTGRFGSSGAEGIFRSLGTKGQIVFFEAPGHLFCGLSIDVEAVDKDSGQNYKFTYEEHPKHRPVFGEELPPGTYGITLNATDYKKSSPITITIEKSGVVRGNRPTMCLQGDKILLSQEDVSFEDSGIIEWYRTLIDRVFQGESKIIDELVTDRYGESRNRKDIMYVIDTSSVEK